jgi:hypothetical protein
VELNKRSSEVIILRVFINSRTVNSKDKSFGYSIDIQTNDIFVSEEIKEQVEKISSWSLNYAPELIAYKFIRDKEPVIEITACQFAAGIYKVNVTNAFEQYLPQKEEYEGCVNTISKDIIGRIVYLFSAYSLQSY